MTPRKHYITFEELKQDVKELASMLEDYSFDGIVAVARGGLIPATLLAHELGIKVIDTVCISSYEDGVQTDIKMSKDTSLHKTNLLIIDDLADTGKTMDYISERYPTAFTTAIYAKPMGMDSIDMFVREYDQDTWLVFPWETTDVG